MLKTLLPLLIVCNLLACSTTVHLYTRDVETNELTQVEQALEHAGFRVRRNARVIPEAVEKPTLVYHPEHSRPAQLDQLATLLEAEGLDLEWVPVSIGNNHYSGNHVGLYLAPYTRQVQEPDARLDNRLFTGICERRDTDLQFDRFGGFTLEQLGNEPADERQSVDRMRGSYLLDDERLMLVFEEGEYPFLIERSVETFTAGGRELSSQVIRLHNESGFLGGCDFSWRETLTL